MGDLLGCPLPHRVGLSTREVGTEKGVEFLGSFLFPPPLKKPPTTFLGFTAFWVYLFYPFKDRVSCSPSLPTTCLAEAGLELSVFLHLPPGTRIRSVYQDLLKLLFWCLACLWESETQKGLGTGPRPRGW